MTMNTIEKIPIYKFKEGQISLNEDSKVLKLLYEQMSILMNIAPEKINLFSHDGDYNSININKELYIAPDILNVGAHYFKSSIVPKLIKKDHPKFKKIIGDYKNFKKYIICQLHKGDIFCKPLKGCGINLGDYMEGFILPDKLEIIGNYFYFNGGYTPLELKALIDDLKIMGGNTSLELRALGEELKIIGKVSNILFNIFEEIYNPNFIITEASFIDDDKKIEYKENELIKSLNIDYASKNTEVELAFNNVEFELKRNGIY